MDLTQELNRVPRVLVAEDDWLNRDLLQVYLANAGCEVKCFENGQAAWNAVCNGFIPDVALLDIQMPKMNGLELCEHLKNDPRTQMTPVVIVTALDAMDEKLRAVDIGADDFIGKPFNATMLLTRVRSLLRMKRLHDELAMRNQLLRQVLNRYVDEEITNVILTDPERHLKLGGDTRQVTVIFADLRGFTPFTEDHSATDVVNTLNRVFEELTGVIFNTGGTFDKYLGDAIMAFYGAPIAREGDAARAVRCALEMQTRFEALRKTGKYDTGQLKGLGIGVHSGEAIVGNIGTERMMDYTVIGDTVNIAKRLQEFAAPGQILISQETLALVPNAQAEPLTSQPLPGKTTPVHMYILKGIEE